MFLVSGAENSFAILSVFAKRQHSISLVRSKTSRLESSADTLVERQNENSDGSYSQGRVY
jgi:hypothetical protein